jgi:S-formylglutathione hydrolase FrmB
VLGGKRRGRGGRLVLAVLGGLGLGVAAGPSFPAGASGAAAPTFVDGAGLRVLGVNRLDARDYDVRVISPDLGRPTDIRLLLPVGYAAHPARRYPVLYLFHGTAGLASDWIVHGHAEQTTAPYPVITVMPEVGFNGDGGFWFTNWVDRTTTHGPSQFEDYLIHSVIPWVDRNLRTIASRDGRAVAGLSQGGYGSAEMAARHPDLFVSMATFSGAPEIERDPEVFSGAIGIIEAIEVGEDRVPPFSELGSPVSDLINWQGHDPATLITNLRGMSIAMWTGTGVDGPLDPGPNPYASAIEALVYQSTQHFDQHLVEEGIPAYYDNYVYGTHTFPYWARDLRAYVPMMMAAFDHPRHPSVISYMSIDSEWSQWGYTVTIDRTPAQQFSSLSDGTAAGFTFSGSGAAIVVTPTQYRHGERLTVRVSAPTGSTSEHLRADAGGRLTIHLDLGAGRQDRVTIQGDR